MRAWLERRYADWVIGSLRSPAIRTRLGRATHPPVLLWGVLVLVFFAVLVIVNGYPFTADAFGLLVVLWLAATLVAGWRLVGEGLSSSYLLRWMLVTGKSSQQAPALVADRQLEAIAEWERRIGSTASASLVLVRERGGRMLRVLLVGVALVQLEIMLSYALPQSLIAAFGILVPLGLLVAGILAQRKLHAAAVRYRADLDDALGPDRPKGWPPADPVLYQEWLDGARRDGAVR